MRYECAQCGETYEAEDKYDLASRYDVEFQVDIDDYEEVATKTNMLANCPNCIVSGVNIELDI